MPSHPGSGHSAGLRTFTSSFLEDLFPEEQRGSAMGRRGRRARRNGSAGGRSMNGDPSPAERRRQLLARREELAVDPSEFERPTLDRQASRINQIVTGVGAVGGLVAALGGSEIGAAAGAGLAKGGAKNLQRQRESFRRRKSAFQEQLANARQFNRELALSTNEARVRGAEAEREREFERGQSRRERRFEREQGQLDQEREEELIKLRDRLEDELNPAEKEALDALTEQRRASAEASRELAGFRRRREAGGETDEREQDLANLTTPQLESMLARGENLIETGLPAGMEEEDRLAVVTGGELPSQTDIDRVAERVNTIRSILQRRGELSEEEQTRSLRQAPPRQNGQSGGGGRPQGGTQRRDVERQGGRFEGEAAPEDVSGQVPEDVRTRILDQIPPDESVPEALNAAQLVMSDTTSFTPQRFERAFGFNPFNR